MKGVAWLAATLMGVACGGAPAGVSGPAAGDVRVGLVEWEVTSDATRLQPGLVALRVTNAGTTEHDLRVSAEGVDAGIPTVVPGERRTIVVDLRGVSEVLLWCSVPGHRAQGMERRLAVGDGVDEAATR